jgi:hypothetical protein
MSIGLHARRRRLGCTTQVASRQRRGNRGRRLGCTARANDEDYGAGIMEAAVFLGTQRERMTRTMVWRHGGNSVAHDEDDGVGAWTGQWSRSWREDRTGR